MDDQNKNLIFATVLSFVVIMVWFVLFPPPEPVIDPTVPTVSAVTGGSTPSVVATSPAPMPADQAAATTEAPRLIIDTPQLVGSISLLGGRIDDLELKSYNQTLAPDSDIVRLLSPVGRENAYYALFGWGPAGTLDYADVPGANTEWLPVSGDTLTPGQPVVLRWENEKGLVFNREIAVDDYYMFTVTDTVQNNGTAEARLFPYGMVARHGKPTNLENFFVSHEGVVARSDGTLTETNYKDLNKMPLVEREGAQAEVVEAATDGWIGFTDKYWMTVLVPEQGKPFTSVMKFVPSANIYQTETRKPVMSVAPRASITSSARVFAGAKEWETIRSYQNDGAVDGSGQPIAGFIDAIDWGWFFFLTKPIFAVLHWLNAAIGNMGLAIIALTFILKVLVLPLAYKSYVSMARMKELQPDMEALKERAGDDKQMMQREMMKLYKDKKVNPAAGCLPILIQIPIFFALYKVIFVTIELRHAPFFGWLRDMSAPDPSSIYNLFGILPWGVPLTGSILHLIFIGVLPILLGISMWLQQKLNPAPTDPIQQQIFAYMPWIFMFMLGGFASGLVLYWITNNTITFMQQYAIMRGHGHKPDLFGNIKSGFKKKPLPVLEKKPDEKKLLEKSRKK